MCDSKEISSSCCAYCFFQALLQCLVTMGRERTVEPSTGLLTMCQVATAFGRISLFEAGYEQHEQVARHLLMACLK